MGVVNLETVGEEDLGIQLNATKVALNISSSAFGVANSSQEYEEDLYRAFSFWIEGIAVTLVSIFGIVGNIACISVFSSKSVDLKPSFANILKCLSIYDICLLSGMVAMYGLPIICPPYDLHVKPHLIPLVLPLSQVALTGSVYSVVVVATERYFNICRPFSTNWGNVCEGGGYIISVVLFSFVYNASKFFEFETTYYQEVAGDNSSYVAAVQLTALRNNLVYNTVYIVINTIVMGVFPLSALIFLNWRIISAMTAATRRHNNIASLKRRDRAMSALLTGVVIVMVVCHTPKTLVNLHESYQMLSYGQLPHEPLWGRIMIKFSHLLLTLSSAVNILIYSYKDFKFRAVLRRFSASVWHRGAGEAEGRPQSQEGSLRREGVTRMTGLPCDEEVKKALEETETTIL